jgi:hypothetical protein
MVHEHPEVQRAGSRRLTVGSASEPKSTRKQLKNLTSLKATLTVQLKLGKAKKPKKYSDPLVLYGPKAAKAPKKAK